LLLLAPLFFFSGPLARAQAIAVMAESGRTGIREVVAASAKGYGGPFLKRLLAGAAKKKGLERATCLR
jgi:hypothetical protein